MILARMTQDRFDNLIFIVVQNECKLIVYKPITPITPINHGNFLSN